MLIEGKITDKSTGVPIPFAGLYLSNADGTPLPSEPGSAISSNEEGEYSFPLFPGQYLAFEYVGYETEVRSHDELKKNPNVKLDDFTGTTLEMVEITAYGKQESNRSKYVSMIIGGFGILGLVILFVIAKKKGWIG